MVLGKYDCPNDEKLNRAIFGSLDREGKMGGGVGEDASDEVKLAAYDKLGGLIFIAGTQNKVKTGSFYDFDSKTARKTPEVVLEFRSSEGALVEIPEGEAIPLQVQAEQLAGKRKGKKGKK